LLVGKQPNPHRFYVEEPAPADLVARQAALDVPFQGRPADAERSLDRHVIKLVSEQLTPYARDVMNRGNSILLGTH
jgi:hypothetical protein